MPRSSGPRLENGQRSILAEVQLNRVGANRAQINRSAIKPRELPRYFSSVLFAPEDLALVRGEPSGRRRFLDQLLVLRSPRLSGVLADYDRVLKQRNTLLKSARARGVRGDALSTLDIWDERLVALGTEIIDERLELTRALREPLRRAYHAVAGDDHGPDLRPQLSISAPTSTRTTMAPRPGPEARSLATRAARRQLTAARRSASARHSLPCAARSSIAAITLVGPHRDDLVFM